MKPKNIHFYLLSDICIKPRCSKNLNDTFFYQRSIDGKNEVKVEKRQLVAELKLKMLNMQKVKFSISTPPPGGTF